MSKKALLMAILGLMLSVSGVYAQYVSINGYVRQYTPDPNDHDTIIGVTVTFIVISPVPDTFTTTVEGNIGVEQGSYYFIDGIPKGSKGSITFTKNHFRFITTPPLPQWIVGSGYGINCSTTVRFNVTAKKNYKEYWLQIWMLDSASLAPITDSNHVKDVIVNFYREDTLKFKDTTNINGISIKIGRASCRERV